MRRKKKSLDSKFISLLAIGLIIAILVGLISNSKSSKTNELQTTTDLAGATRPTSEEFIEKALKVDSYSVRTQTGYSCSSFIVAVFDELGYTIDDSVWSVHGSNVQNINIKDKATGQIYHPEYVKGQVSANGSWVSRLGGVSDLRPGDIISGGCYKNGSWHGHMLMYMGEGNSLVDLTSSYPENYTYFNKNQSSANLGQDNRVFYQQQPIGEWGTTSWYIEGNIGWDSGIVCGNGLNVPTLRNYSWIEEAGQGQSNTMTNLHVYRFSSEAPQTYTGGVGFYKFIDENNNGEWDNGEEALSGAVFGLYRDAAHTDPVMNGNKPYTVPTGQDGYACFENIDLGTNTSGTFYLYEEDVDETKYNRLTDTIKVTVSSDFNSTDLASFHEHDIGNTPIPEGSFRLKVIKEKSTSNEVLTGAKFKVKINKAGTEEYLTDHAGRVIDGEREFAVDTVDPNKGILTFYGIHDLEVGTTYHINIVESTPPTGYVGISNPIDFDVVARLDGTSIVLTEGTPTVQNAKSVAIQPSEVTVRVGNQALNKGKGGLFKFEDTNGNGRHDEGEPALSGATFALATTKADADAGRYITGQTATTNEDGFATFTNIDLGTDTQREFWIRETVAPEGYDLIEQSFPIMIKSDPNIDYTNLDNVVVIPNKKKIYDLALRKYITAVKDGATGETTEVTTRIPKVTVPENFNTEECTTLKYEHTKDPVLVHTTDIVTYNIEVYNEGPSDAYSELTKDDIPEGLEFLPDAELNKEHRWIMVDENDEEVTDPSKAKYIITDYLSKEQAEANDRDNLIKAFDPETMELPDSRIIKVQFKVTEPTTSNRILVNKAQIMKETDKNGNVVKDRDSTPNEWLGEDDEDYEQVRVLYFDLALRKWVVQAIVTQDGKETIYETGHKAEDDPEDVVKVDLKKSKLNNVTVKFKYKIRITNEGEIAGEAKVVRDDVPKGLKFVQADNPEWKEEDGKIVTEQLADVTLEPGESVEMDIILTWINGEENMGVMDNISEIEKDHNKYGTHDIDSTPGNDKWGEDDIDDAPVMLAITTGSEIIKYVTLAVGLITFIGISGIIIKKKVLKY